MQSDLDFKFYASEFTLAKYFIERKPDFFP